LSGNSNGVSWGVTYSSSTGDFSGEAWGGDVVGWISFCDTAPFASGANRYCVKAQNTQNTQIAPPTITSISNVTSNGFTVQWTNPQDYSRVEVYVSSGGNINDFSKSTPKAKYSKTDPQSKKCGNASNCTTPVIQTSIVSGLTSGTLYGVKVRGYK